MNVSRLYCYTTDKTACAGWGEDESTNHYIVLVPDIKEIDEEITHVNGVEEQKDQQVYVSNVAFLSTIGFGGGVSNLAKMAISNVSYRVTLNHKRGERGRK